MHVFFLKYFYSTFALIRNRCICRHILADAITNGKRVGDPRKAKDAVKIVETMFRNGKKYDLNIIYREIDKTIIHFHYEKVCIK